MRRVLLPLTAVAMALVPAGCGVPDAGFAGIGVDGAGNLVGYIHVCHDHIDGATLYYDTRSTSESASTADAGAWEASAPVTETATWSLSQPTNGWTALQPLQQLVPEREYTLYGWTNDNSWSAGDVTFTLADVARLKPGQVLHWSGRSGGESDRDLNEVSSLANFEIRACLPNSSHPRERARCDPHVTPAAA